MPYCKKCGNEINPNHKFCAKCGTAITQATPPQPQSQQQEQQQPQANNKRICPVCGSELKENQKFCIKCGTAAHTVPQQQPPQQPQPPIQSTFQNIGNLNSSQSTAVKPKKKRKKLWILLAIISVVLIVAITLGIVFLPSILNSPQTSQQAEGSFSFNYIDFSEKLSALATQAEGVKVEIDPDNWIESEDKDQRLYFFGDNNLSIIGIIETDGSQNKKTDNISCINVCGLSDDSAVRMCAYCGVIASGDEYTSENIQNWYSAINYAKNKGVDDTNVDSEKPTMIKYKNILLSYFKNIDSLLLKPVSESSGQYIEEFQPNIEATQSNTLNTTQPPTEPPTSAPCPESYEQKVEVISSGTTATLTLYEWQNGKWKSLMTTNATVGQNGVGINYGEGEKITPQGTFDLGFCYGLSKPDTKLEFTKLEYGSIFVCDSSSKYYNCLTSMEHFNGANIENTYAQFAEQNKYNYNIFIEHNGDGKTPNSATPGKGSVITICGYNGTLKPTWGCIDITTTAMTELLSYLDSSKNPVIIIS